MGRRTNTARWIEQRNHWRIDVQKDGQRKTFYSSIPGRTGQREANRKADAWLDDNIAGNPRVEVLWESYLESCDTTPAGTPEKKRNGGYIKAKSIGENYILPFMGQMKIDRVTEGTLQRLVDKAYKTGSLKKEHKQRRPQSLPLSRKSVMGIIGTVKSFMKYCRKVEHVTTLRPDDLKVPEGARYKGKRILQPDSVVTLFTVDTTVLRGQRIFDEYIYAYRFEVSAGLRPGELKGLRVGDVNPKTKEVRSQRSINVFGTETQGKNENSVRGFVMNRHTYAAYLAQMNLLRESGVEINLNTPLFQISSHSGYYGRWKRYQRANGLPGISLYELRHTFVSIVKTLPEGQVKPLVGHSRNMDTFGVYGHMLDGEAQQTADDVSGVFDEIVAVGTKKDSNAG